jgi:hypothetical protein
MLFIRNVNTIISILKPELLKKQSFIVTKTLVLWKKYLNIAWFSYCPTKIQPLRLYQIMDSNRLYFIQRNLYLSTKWMPHMQRKTVSNFLNRRKLVRFHMLKETNSDSLTYFNWPIMPGIEESKRKHKNNKKLGIRRNNQISIFKRFWKMYGICQSIN